MIKLDETSKEFKDIEAQWYEEVKTIDSKNKLNKFIDKIMKGYEHDFGTYVHAVAVCTKAFIRLYGGGFDSMQASFLMWELIRKTFNCNDKFGLQLIHYEWLMYPQLLYRFEVEIDEDTHEKIIEEAKKLLEEDKTAKAKAVDKVREHWEKLASGWLPECVKLKKPKESEVKA